MQATMKSSGMVIGVSLVPSWEQDSCKQVGVTSVGICKVAIGNKGISGH